MTYRESICFAMDGIATDQAVRFVGYNVQFGRAGGTLNGVPEAQLIETPVAEGLMAGIAIGLSIMGYKPVLFFERADFLLNAADALVNHLNSMAELSRGQFTPAAIIRVVVGNRNKPLFTGCVHTQNLAPAFRAMVKFPVLEPETPSDMVDAYRQAKQRIDVNLSTMIFEFKDSL